jgi:hypothetical protein
MTAQAFREAAPGDVEIVDCPPDRVVEGLDRYVIHNCMTYSPGELPDAPLFKYCHDVMPHIAPAMKRELVERAALIFCSTEQRDRMGLEGEVIPPAGTYEKLPPNPQRTGTCTVAQWRNYGKGGVAIEEWAAVNGPVHSYGPGPFHPRGRYVEYRGELEPEEVPDVLWTYERFVFLPDEFEPFCRTVAEAFYAGCEIVTNGLVGARDWLTADAASLNESPERFWSLICA